MLVFDGDSLTIGVGAEGNSYPLQVLDMLLPTHYNSAILGVGGQTCANMITDAATQVDPIYNVNNAHNIVCVLVGTNDILAGTAEAAYANIVSYCQSRQAVGFKVIICTMGIANGDATWLARRLTLNGLIVSGYATFADAIARVDLDPHIGDAGNPVDPIYLYNQFHYTAAGYKIIAELVANAVQGL